MRNIDQSIIILALGLVGYGVYQLYEGAKAISDGVQTAATVVKKEITKVGEGMVKAGEFGTPEYFIDITKGQPLTTNSLPSPEILLGTSISLANNPYDTIKAVTNTFANTSNDIPPAEFVGRPLTPTRELNTLDRLVEVVTQTFGVSSKSPSSQRF